MPVYRGIVSPEKCVPGDTIPRGIVSPGTNFSGDTIPRYTGVYDVYPGTVDTRHDEAVSDLALVVMATGTGVPAGVVNLVGEVG